MKRRKLGILVLVALLPVMVIAAEKSADQTRLPVDRDGNPIPTVKISDGGWNAAAKDKSLYLVIPIRGEIGKEVLGPGVDRAIAYAIETRSIKHIVFDIDSPGGQIAVAKEIVTSITRAKSLFSFHAHIRRAHSSAIWIAFACDRIWTERTASIGGALPFIIDATGNIAVDEKLISIFAAEVAATAGSAGYPESIARAMVQPKAMVYATPNKTGGWTFANSKPQGDGAEVIDDTDQLLTMTAASLVKYGISRPLQTGPAGIGSELKLENWKMANEYGIKSMEYAMVESQVLYTAREWRAKAEAETAEVLAKSSLPPLRADATAAEKIKHQTIEQNLKRRAIAHVNTTGSGGTATRWESLATSIGGAFENHPQREIWFIDNAATRSFVVRDSADWQRRYRLAFRDIQNAQRKAVGLSAFPFAEWLKKEGEVIQAVGLAGY